MSGAQHAPRGAYRRRPKYAALPTVMNGFRFASKAESRRYAELLLLGAAGEIRNLELQPRFPLIVGGERVGVYVGDFRYDERTSDSRSMWMQEWRDVVEDVKGVKTPVYRLKKRIFEAQYGIPIRETK